MNGLGAASTEGPNEEAQGLSRKRVANAVRKVVSKVLPGEEPVSAKEPPGRATKSPEHPARGKRGEKAASNPKPPPPPPPPPPPALPKPEAKKEAAKDELSVGLRSLMSRGRGKDHKPRGKQSAGKGEKPPSQEPGSLGKPGSPDLMNSPEKAAKPKTPEKPCSPALPRQLADPGSVGPKSNLTGEQQSKSPGSGVQQEVPECDTNLPCPSPLSPESQLLSQPASPSLTESCMTVLARVMHPWQGCMAVWLSLTECQNPGLGLRSVPVAGMGSANQHAVALPWQLGLVPSYMVPA